MAAPHPSSAAIIDLYQRHAAVWIERRGGQGPAPFETPWLDRFLALLPDKPALLDIGCGAGDPIADYMIARDAVMTGVDASPPLLAQIRTRHGQPHTWIEADMHGLDLGRTFDGALAWHSAFHLTQEDQRGMFPVYARHVRPGGALMFTGGPAACETIGDWEGEPLYHASLDPAEYDALLDAHGFDLVDRVLSAPDVGGACIWLARRRPS